ncbi:MAG: Fur family transcriptional regulator [Crocosphaera sp.]
MKAQYTPSQTKIIRVLKSLNDAISAQDLYIELKNRDHPLGLATVYRGLEALKAQGIVKSRTLSSGEALYSLVSHDKHYINCVSCGQSFAINECPIQNLEKRLEKTYNFQVYYHTLEFFGRCHQCHAKSVT